MKYKTPQGQTVRESLCSGEKQRDRGKQKRDNKKGRRKTKGIVKISQQDHTGTKEKTPGEKKQRQQKRTKY